MNAESAPNTILRGHQLAVARLAWIALVALALAAFVALIPINLRSIYYDWQIERSAQALGHLISRQSYAMYMVTLRYVVASVFFATGAVIFWRKSDDWMAIFASLVLMIVPLTFNLGGYTETWGIYPQPWRWLFRAVRDFLAVLGPFGFLTLFYLFPDGRFMPRWMGRVALGGFGMAFLLFLVSAFRSIFARALSLGDDAVGDWVWWVWILTFLVSMTTVMLGQIYRYRHVSTPAQRQQTKLVVFGLAVAPLGFFISLVLGFLPPGSRYAALYGLVAIHLELFILVLIPLTIAFSILRYRLWDIDLIINRTLVYGALTLIVVGLYGLVVGTVGALFQIGGNLLLSILATGLIAILFQPLRQRLQRGVNRLMYGERDDPVTVLSRLGQRLETAITPEAVLPMICETVAQALKLPHAAIALKDGDEFNIVAEYRRTPTRPRAAPDAPAPSNGAQADIIPLIYQSETVGQLIVAARAPGEALTPADRRLLEEIARQAGASVHAVRLTVALQHSRERLVTAREAERRRLRRDLHDGLGPTLASQTFKLDAALDLLESDPAAARRLLAELKAQTQTTVAEIRRLVYELRPPALDELGLVSAIGEQAARYSAADQLDIAVEAPQDLPALSAAVEVAAYRIALEALTNVARHARARECLVRLSASNDGVLAGHKGAAVLQLEIADDGVGLSPDGRAGVGLTSMRERAAELGGTCVVERASGGGTRVVARLPILE